MRITSEIDSVPVMSTTELSKRLGVQVSSTLLREIGVQPCAVLPHGTYWQESQMFEIRYKLSGYILSGAAIKDEGDSRPKSHDEARKNGMKQLFDMARKYGWKG